MKLNSIKSILKVKGDNVYYVPLTDEILALALPPRKKGDYTIQLTFEGKDYSLGPMVFIGTL